MRAWVLIIGLIALGGCEEVYRGPRLVHYNPDWFYIRHAPLVDGRGEVDQLAAEQCPATAPVRLVTVAQYYPFDLRDATYRCEQLTPPASMPPDLPPEEQAGPRIPDAAAH
jgi:hypothetical protein